MEAIETKKSFLKDKRTMIGMSVLITSIGGLVWLVYGMIQSCLK